VSVDTVTAVIGGSRSNKIGDLVGVIAAATVANAFHPIAEIQSNDTLLKKEMRELEGKMYLVEG
jgi:hypothetical protein